MTSEELKAERADIVAALTDIPKPAGEMTPYKLGDRIRWIVARMVYAEAKNIEYRAALDSLGYVLRDDCKLPYLYAEHQSSGYPPKE